MKKGFTLAELLISIGVIGVLTLLVVSATTKVKPNQELVMFKKAYSITERVVTEIINNADFYPADSTFEDIATFAEVNGERYTGNAKFCNLFALQINSISPIQCEDSSFDFTNNLKQTTDKITLITSDGMQWLLPISAFSNPDTAENIKIDVNGDKGPNCSYSDKCRKPDRFTIKVYQDGRVEPGSDVEKEYLLRENPSDNSPISVDPDDPDEPNDPDEPDNNPDDPNNDPDDPSANNNNNKRNCVNPNCTIDPKGFKSNDNYFEIRFICEDGPLTCRYRKDSNSMFSDELLERLHNLAQ